MTSVYVATTDSGHPVAVFSTQPLAEAYTRAEKNMAPIMELSLPHASAVVWLLVEHKPAYATVRAAYDTPDKGHAEARRRSFTLPRDTRVALYSAQLHTTLDTASDPAVQIAQPSEPYNIKNVPLHERPQSWRMRQSSR